MWRRALMITAFTFVVGGVPGDAIAQICGKPGDLKVMNFYSQNSVAKTFLLSKLTTMTWQESKDTFGADFEYDGVPINISNEGFSAFQQYLKKLNIAQAYLSNDIKIVQEYGDPTLLKAYEACIRPTPLKVRVVSQRDITSISVSFESIAGVPSTKIRSASKFTDVRGVTILKDTTCRVGFVINDRSSCVFLLRIPDPTTVVPFQLTPDKGNAVDGLIAPRMHLQVDSNVPIEDKYTQPRRGSKLPYILNETVVERDGITTSSGCTELAPDTFVVVDNKNQVPRVNPVFLPGFWGSSLAGSIVDTPDGLQPKVCFSVQCNRKDYNNYTQCGATLVGKMTTIRWVPDDPFASRPQLEKIMREEANRNIFLLHSREKQ